MSSDTLLGFCLAIPLYAIILFLFKDIVFRSFINKLLNGAKTEIGPAILPEEAFSSQEFKDAVEVDLLTSYKLLLILKGQFKFLKDVNSGKFKKLTSEQARKVFSCKLSEVEDALVATEALFDKMGNKEYLQIKHELETVPDNFYLF